MREREAKLLVSSDYRLPRFDRLGHGLRVAADETILQRAVHFDTADLRLTRSGASLRYRSDDGWTVKLPAPAEGANLVRTEITVPGDRAAPPAEAIDLLRAWVRTAPVEQVAEVRTSRHRVVLNDAGGTKIAEIDDDRVTTSNRDGSRHAFREVEVELGDRAPAGLDRLLAKQVKKAGSTKKSSLSKIARGLDVQSAISAETGAARLDVHPGAHATTLELVRAVIGDSVQRLLANDPAIRICEDPEGVHQARVATRRLRSDLRTFGPVLDERWCESLRTDLQWLGAVLGKVRDADVLTELLRATVTRLPDDERARADPLFDRLAHERARERQALLTVMRSKRYAVLLDRLVDASCDPLVLPEVRERRARKVAFDLARKPWRRCCKSIRRLGAAPSDADLHRTRRRAKQARYALEAISPVAGGREAKRAELAAGIQGTLGDHQDRVVARQWLLDTARAINQPQAAFVAGELAVLLSVEQQALRKRARKVCNTAWRS